jgi:CheY-like chemotaxis protein
LLKAQAGIRRETQPYRGRVLVMDDDDLIRTMVSEVLKTIGLEALLAADGVEAMRLYHSAKDAGKPVDVILMDMMIPHGQGGMETIRQLRAIDATTKVVVSSGYHNASALVDYRSWGFDEKLAKPYSSTELKTTLLNLLNLENVAGSIGSGRPTRLVTAN